MLRALFALASVILVALVGWFWIGNRWGDRLLDSPHEQSEVALQVLHDTLRFQHVAPCAVELMCEGSGSGSCDVSCDVTCDGRSLYTFADTTASERWRAEVVGRDVELRSLMLVDRVELRSSRSVVHRRPDWAVSLRGGVGVGGVGGGYSGSWVGVGVERNFGIFGVGVDAGANPVTGAPSLAARASVTLWQR